MKTTRRILSAVMALTLLITCTLTFASCKDDGKYTVGIIQLVDHDALDAATQGFKDALVEELGEENVTFDYQNAGGSADTCGTIANTLVSKRVDLIMANATSALQAAANATVNIPILGTSITDYTTALDLKDFNGIVGGNISGTCDLAPLTEQAKMIKEMFPDAKNVGILFCSAEPNSQFQSNVIKPELEAMGYTVSEFKFTDTNDVTAVTQAAAAASDVIYIPTDNTAASCTETIYGAMTGKKTPIVAGEEGICKGCGVATLSISYYDLGYATGKMAAKILKGEAKIAEMPIEYASATTKKYNPVICADLGITPPTGYEAIVIEEAQ